MTPADVLDAAADLLEKTGWIQGTWQRDGKYCVIGAVFAVEANGTNARWDAEQILVARFGSPVGRWNDAPDRTADEVIETLRKVAAEARWSE